MAINKHGMYGVLIDKVADVLIGAITTQQINTGSEYISDALSDELYPRWQGLRSQRPGAMFTTLAVAKLLAECTVQGAQIVSGGTITGVHFYAQKHADGGTRAGAASHKKYTFNEGMLVPRTLSAAGQGDASLSCEVVSVYDGSNDPIVIAESQSLPANMADDERFALGGITIESIALTSVRSLEIDFGVGVITEGEGSDQWPTFIGIQTWQPSIRIRGIDPAWFKDTGGIPLEGKAITHDNTAIYLRKRAVAGSASSWVADGTAQHIKFTTEGIAYIDTPADGGTGAAETSLVIMPYFDGTNAPLIVDTASAIT